MTSSELRKKLNLECHAYLPARDLAKYFSVKLFLPTEVPGFNQESAKKIIGLSNWSAITIIKNSDIAIILNGGHSHSRQESNLFHELAHIICKHPLSKFVKIGNSYLREFNEEHEEEAKWLGGCLHIPRIGLEWAIKKKMMPDEICYHFSASDDMLKYRINVTGIKQQYKYYCHKFL